MRERENKRKANIRKKNEKIEREREARHRMGIASPVKETVGASQMRLSKFLDFGTGFKRQWEDCPALTPQSSSEECRASQNSNTVQNAAQGRRPLEPLSQNHVRAPSAQMSAHTPANLNRDFSAPSKPRAPKETDRYSKGSLSKRMDSSVGLSCPKAASNGHPKDSTMATSISTTNMSPQPAVPISSQTPGREPYKPVMLAGSMRPPPRPTAAAAAKPFKDNAKSPIANPGLPMPSGSPQSRKPPVRRPPCPSPSPRPPHPRTSNDILIPSANLAKAQTNPSSDDGWAAFLVSNTQIERELSSPDTVPTVVAAAPAPTKPSRQPTHRKLGLTAARQPITRPPLPLPPKKPPKDETAALLAGICTQDLDYGGEVSSDDANEVRQPDAATQSFGGDDLSDSELEDIAKDVERASSPQDAKVLSDHQPQAKETFCEDDFDISTQELCELVA